MTAEDVGAEHIATDEGTTEELAAQFDARLAELRTTTDLQAITIRTKRAAYVRHSGRVTSTEYPDPTGTRKSCAYHSLTDVAGTGITAADGTSRFVLSDLVCGPLTNVDDPVSLIATPRTDRPIYLTTTINVQHSNSSEVGDVEFRVFAWGPGGNPRARVPFAFRILVPGYLDIPEG